jgi:hypothetical protein
LLPRRHLRHLLDRTRRPFPARTTSQTRPSWAEARDPHEGSRIRTRVRAPPDRVRAAWTWR